MKNIRIGNVEFIHDPEFNKHFTSEYTISLWFPNEYYGKYEEYLRNGYVENGDMISKDNIHLDKRLFDNREKRYVIAKIEPNRQGDEFNIVSYGIRCFELSDSDFKDLKRVIGIFSDEFRDQYESRIQPSHQVFAV